MPSDSHLTAPTRFVDANGTRFAYRQFGDESGTPILCFQHFRGGMDNWDPLVTDGLAAGRPVILYNYAGSASSGGQNKTTFDAMADDAAAFLAALGLDRVDVLGFSIGGFVAQSLAHRHADLVRKLVLVGTGPKAGEPSTDPKVPQVAGNPVPVEDDFLFLFFSPSDAGQAAGRAFWKRRTARPDADPPSAMETAGAQVAAMREWLTPGEGRQAYLSEITQPTLVVGGSNDRMIPTPNSVTLFKAIPNAELILYPDSGHGSLFQYPETFVAHARLFLDSDLG